MVLRRPGKNFNERSLEEFIETVSGCLFRLSGFPKPPLWFAQSGGGRFDCPPDVQDERKYGVSYLGKSIRGAFGEKVLRVGLDEDGFFPIEIDTVKALHLFCFEVEEEEPLRVLDVTGSRGTKLCGESSLSIYYEQSIDEGVGGYGRTQEWSLAIKEHPSSVDGILYRSRHNDEEYCIALFECAENKVHFVRKSRLEERPKELLGLLEEFCL